MHEKIGQLNEALTKLSQDNSFQNAKNTVNSVIQLLGIEDETVWRTFTDTNGRIVSNGSWLKKAEGFADRRGAYKLYIDEKYNLDLKAFWVNNKIDKPRISMLVAITPNFEDEPFYSTKNVGIDFIIPEECDKIVIVLSKNYIIRTVELKDYLSETQKEILSKWLKITDFTNKPQLHEILWQSFDLESVNKQFYKGICEFFTELKQHLVSEKVFDSRHAAYFTNRLIGRMVFCRFLDKKGIISRERKYFETEGKPSTEYYREKLEVLFFKVFNTPIEDREVGADDKTPFLNGGLFEIKENDKYKDDKLTFPTDYFSRLFEFLKHYNFTTDESTSAFQQVAIDPEMLGKIFENLLAEQVEETGEQARKAKGAFYTPREIVDYMCKESLREYLKTQVTEARDRDDKISLLLDTKPHIWRDQQRNYQKDLEPFKIQIFDALDKAKILDPACGSGAFPMGMMQLLLMCYERLEPRFEAYKTKLNIIKNNLYGVDIEPMAVEISRLRAWLSIIVDKEGDIRKIEPLPNLDFKFVCANSLIPLDKSGQMNLMDDTDLEDKITALRDKYYDEKTVKGKNSLRKEFESLISAKEFGMEKSKKQEQLESYHPFDSENICQFFDPEFMFSQTGFDIVIGNPPYVNVENLNQKTKDLLFDSYTTCKGRTDIYIAFIEFSLRIAKESAVFSYIIPFAYTNQKYGTLSRKMLIDNAYIKEIIDTTNYFVFETAMVKNVIIKVIKASNGDKLTQIKTAKESGDFIKNSFVLHSLNQKQFLELKDYRLETKNLLGLIDLKTKLWKNSYRFDNICFIAYGARLNHRTQDIGKDNFIHGKFSKGLKPFLEGKNIERYKASQCGWLDYQPEIHYNSMFPELFENDKLIFINVVKDRLRFAYDDKKLYNSHTVINCLKWDKLKPAFHISVKKSITTEKIEIARNYHYYFLLAILNSKLLNWYFYNFLSESLHFYPDDAKELPIKQIPANNQKTIIEIVNSILEIKKNSDTDTTELENQIDVLVYKLYELTYDEVKIIDPEIEKIISQADYEKMEIE